MNQIHVSFLKESFLLSVGLVFSLSGSLGFTNAISTQPIDALNSFSLSASKVSIQKISAIETPQAKTPQFVSTGQISTPQKSKPAQAKIVSKSAPPIPVTKMQNQATLTIDKLGLNNVNLSYGSAYDIKDIDNKLLYGPVIENQLTPDICSANGNSYIYGHSEPAKSSTVGYPGVYIFSNLTKMKVGDIFSLSSRDGKACSYKVSSWDKVLVDNNDKISNEEFNRVFYPADSSQGMLTIQTCQKGSSTVRLLLRSVLIKG